MNKKKFIAWIILFPFIGIVAILGFSIILGRHTTYCPFSHWIRDTSSCFVLDKQGNRVLIQHADLDTSTNNYMEIRKGSKSSLFIFPEFIMRFAPKGYKATLINEEENIILIDEKRHKLTPLGNKNDANQNTHETENQ